MFIDHIKVKVKVRVYSLKSTSMTWSDDFTISFPGIGTHTTNITSPSGECSAHVVSYSQSQNFYDIHRSTRYLFILLGTQRHTWSEKLAQGFYTWLSWVLNPSLWIKSPGILPLSHMPPRAYVGVHIWCYCNTCNTFLLHYLWCKWNVLVTLEARG